MRHSNSGELQGLHSGNPISLGRPLVLRLGQPGPDHPHRKGPGKLLALRVTGGCRGGQGPQNAEAAGFRAAVCPHITLPTFSSMYRVPADHTPDWVPSQILSLQKAS